MLHLSILSALRDPIHLLRWLHSWTLASSTASKLFVMLIGSEANRGGGRHSVEIWQHLKDRGMKIAYVVLSGSLVWAWRIKMWSGKQLTAARNRTQWQHLGLIKKRRKGLFLLWECKSSVHQCGGHCSCCIPRCDRREAWRNKLSSPWPRAVNSSPGTPHRKYWHNSCWKSWCCRETQQRIWKENRSYQAHEG